VVDDKKKNLEHIAYLDDADQEMTLQDSLIALATYAAQIDISANPSAAETVADLASENPLFEEEYDVTLKRVNKFANQMRASDEAIQILNKAADSLTGDLKGEAWNWARAMSEADFTASKEGAERLRHIETILAVKKDAVPKNSDLDNTMGPDKSDM
jgi:hypothetical protein